MSRNSIKPLIYCLLTVTLQNCQGCKTEKFEEPSDKVGKNLAAPKGSKLNTTAATTGSTLPNTFSENIAPTEGTHGNTGFPENISPEAIENFTNWFKNNRPAFISSFVDSIVQKIKAGDKNAVNEPDNRAGFTILQYAICSGNEAFVSMLLSLEPDLTQQNEHGSTPLIRAVSTGHPAIVKLLLAQPKAEEFIHISSSSSNTTALGLAYSRKAAATTEEAKERYEQIIQALQAKNAT